MIGHYLLTLDTEAEDRVLTERMDPGSYYFPNLDGGVQRCLVGVAAGFTRVDNCTVPAEAALAPRFVLDMDPYWDKGFILDSVEDRYDSLCERFTTERINRAIRARIWTNRGLRLAMQAPVAQLVEQGTFNP